MAKSQSSSILQDILTWFTLREARAEVDSVTWRHYWQPCLELFDADTRIVHRLKPSEGSLVRRAAAGSISTQDARNKLQIEMRKRTTHGEPEHLANDSEEVRELLRELCPDFLSSGVPMCTLMSLHVRGRWSVTTRCGVLAQQSMSGAFSIPPASSLAASSGIVLVQREIHRNREVLTARSCSPATPHSFRLRICSLLTNPLFPEAARRTRCRSTRSAESVC